MTTSIEDALEAVSYLPERGRLLIGRGMGIDEMDWEAGSMTDTQFLASIGDRAIQKEISEQAIKFKAGDSKAALTLSITSSGGFVVAIFGPSSIEGVADLLTRTANEFTGKYVSNYLAEKRDLWKRPLATVLAFRRRSR